MSQTFIPISVGLVDLGNEQTYAIICEDPDVDDQSTQKRAMWMYPASDVNNSPTPYGLCVSNHYDRVPTESIIPARASLHYVTGSMRVTGAAYLQPDGEVTWSPMAEMLALNAVAGTVIDTVMQNGGQFFVSPERGALPPLPPRPTTHQVPSTMRKAKTRGAKAPLSHIDFLRAAFTTYKRAFHVPGPDVGRLSMIATRPRTTMTIITSDSTTTRSKNLECATCETKILEPSTAEVLSLFDQVDCTRECGVVCRRCSRVIDTTVSTSRMLADPTDVTEADVQHAILCMLKAR